MKELEIKYQSSKKIMKKRTIDFNYNIRDSPLTQA